MDTHNNPISPWIIIGDETKYIFAKWCGSIADDITTEQLRSKDVFLYYDVLPHIEIGRESISIYSDRLLPYSYAYIPKSNDHCIPDNTSNTTVLIFEGFPFGKDTTKILTDEWRRADHSVLNVLMELPNRRGSTDLQLNIDPAEEIEKEYYEREYTAIRISEMSDITKIFYWHESVISHWKLKAKNELDKFEDNISSFLFDYLDWILDATYSDETVEHILSTRKLFEISSLTGICSLKMKNISIKQAYRQSIEKLIFESSDFEMLLYSFIEICQCIVCPIDSEKLRAKVKKELKKLLFVKVDELFTETGDLRVSQLTEELFEEIITDEKGKLYGINEKISDLIREFFGVDDHENNAVLYCLTELMKSYLKKMEDLLA